MTLSSNRHPALALFEHDLFGKPGSTFPDHALAVAGNKKNDGYDRAGANDQPSRNEAQVDTQLRAEERQYNEEANQDYQAVRLRGGRQRWRRASAKARRECVRHPAAAEETD